MALVCGSRPICSEPRSHGGTPGASEGEAPALLHPRCPDQPPAAQAQRRGAAGAARVSAATGTAGPGPILSIPYPSGSRASAGDPAEGAWGWEAASSVSGLPTSPSEACEAGPPTPPPPRALDAGSGTLLHLLLAQVCALPAGSASDCFPRQPRGKRGPGVCGGGVQGEQTWAPERHRQGGRLRAVKV